MLCKIQCYQMVEEELDRPKAESTCLERFGNHSLLVTPQNKQTQDSFKIKPIRAQ